MTAHCHTFQPAARLGGSFLSSSRSSFSVPSMGGTYPGDRRESVARTVGFDNKRINRAMADTQGLSDPERALFWIERLTEAEHRGRHDTWTAARDRAAAKAGAPVSRVKRLWERWDTMKDVAGSVMIPLMLAYEDLCQRIEDKAGEYERQVLQLKGGTNEIGDGPVPTGAGMAAATPREEGFGG